MGKEITGDRQNTRKRKCVKETYDGKENGQSSSNQPTKLITSILLIYFFLGAEKTGQGLENGMKSTPPMKGTRGAGILIPLSV